MVKAVTIFELVASVSLGSSQAVDCRQTHLFVLKTMWDQRSWTAQGVNHQLEYYLALISKGMIV